jgi:putative sigma-54 modulation protein
MFIRHRPVSLLFSLYKGRTFYFCDKKVAKREKKMWYKEGLSHGKGEYIDIDERRSIYMQYNTRGENIEVTPALRDYAEKKIGRLERYFENTSSFSCNVTLRVLRGEHTVEVTIPMPGLILRAEETNSDMYAAIDLVVEKLERQIRKYKTKVNRKYRQQGAIFADAVPVSEGQEGHVEDEHDAIHIVRNKRFNLKPMDAEEAVLQMDMLGHNFFVFSNADTEEVNVVYRRKDGRYGLIEPENV